MQQFQVLNKLEKMSSLFSYEPWVMTLVLQCELVNIMHVFIIT
jgi:hypothetical protein